MPPQSPLECIIEEPIMIYATAGANPYTPAANLSTTYKRCKTYASLCLTAGNTLEACCNLSTEANLQLFKCCAGTLENVRP